jgi:hypothetical protein
MLEDFVARLNWRLAILTEDVLEVSGIKSVF